MAKRRRKDKELARLRREVEVLRAQLAGQEKKETKPATTEAQSRTETRKAPRAPSTTQTVDPKFIKADLLKSAVLTLLALGAIVALTIIL